MENKKRNASIDIFRIICAVMVIAIHTHPLEDVNKDVSYLFTQIIPRIAVPFFFTVSGYYYLKKIQTGEKIFKRTIIKYLKLYMIWSCIYLIVSLVQWINQGVKVDKIIKKIMSGLLINGISEHLWFFLGIFFCLAISTWFYKVFRKINILFYVSIGLFIIGLLGTSYSSIGIKFDLLNNLVSFKYYTIIRRIILMGFPFFMMGYFILKVDLNMVKRKIAYIIEGILIVLFVLEITVIDKNKLGTNIVMTIMLYPLVLNTMLVLLKDPLQKFQRIAKECRNVANFIYYSHVLVLILIQAICRKVLKISSPTINFFTTTTLCTLIGIILEKMDNKYINKLYK